MASTDNQSNADVADELASSAGVGAPQAAAVASEIIVSTGAENHPTPATELLRADAGNVRADQVAMERAGAEQITAERVIMTNSGARTIQAHSAQVDRSGVLAMHSEKAVLSHTTALAVATQDARIVRGKVFALKADAVTLEGEVHVALYAGPPVDGMRPLFDAPAAAALGAGFGAAALLLGGLLRRLARK
jgi:hypothetical protein